MDHRAGPGCVIPPGAPVPTINVPGTFEASATHVSSVNRTVNADRDTIRQAITLQGVLAEPVDWQDAVNFSEERVDVCVIDRATALDEAGVLTAIALGVRVDADRLRDLVGEELVVVKTRTITVQEVELDEDVVLAVLSLAGTGDPVRFEDVVTAERTTRTERSVERVTDIDRGDALASLAIPRDDT